MPVQIRELVIKAEVLPENAKHLSDERPSEEGKQLSEEEKSAIIRECVAQILMILEKQKDR